MDAKAIFTDWVKPILILVIGLIVFSLIFKHFMCNCSTPSVNVPAAGGAGANDVVVDEATGTVTTK